MVGQMLIINAIENKRQPKYLLSKLIIDSFNKRNKNVRYWLRIVTFLKKGFIRESNFKNK